MEKTNTECRHTLARRSGVIHPVLCLSTRFGCSRGVTVAQQGKSAMYLHECEMETLSTK